jgi:radical SAM superfamily enzyme YgiQ (UPF0313 family)
MPKEVDLIVVKPGNPKAIYGDLSKSFSAIEPPVWGGMIAEFIRKKGYSVEILDMETEGLGIEDFAQKIIESNPTLVAITVMGSNPSASSTPLVPVTRELLNALKSKNPEIKTILTGIHPSALPERTLKEEKTDFIAKGEPFYTILELLELLKSGENPKNYSIQGLCYLDKGKPIINGWGKIIEDPKELPSIPWDIILPTKYRSHNWQCLWNLKERTPYAVTYTSLGCPYNCSYCNIHALYNGKPLIRFREPKDVVKEIDYLVQNYKVKTIKFLDELFAINEERVEKICDLLAERNYDLNIWVYARINTVNERMLQKMKKAGIKWLCYGIESANELVRKGVEKFGFGKEDIKRIIKMTQDAGLYVMGNFIFGLPDDNLETMRETLRLAEELNCEYVNFYCAMAYPGSRLYEEAIQKGWELPKSWLGYAQLSEETLPLPTKYLSGREVLRFRDEAFREYFSRPEYLSMIQEKFGKEAVLHIKEMLKHKIKRKYL